MKKRMLLTPTVLIGITGLAAAAFAATQTKSGEVRSTDAAKHELVLTTGEAFDTASTVKLDKFKAGDKVTVTYETKNGKMLASRVTASK